MGSESSTQSNELEEILTKDRDYSFSRYCKEQLSSGRIKSLDELDRVHGGSIIHAIIEKKADKCMKCLINNNAYLDKKTYPNLYNIIKENKEGKTPIQLLFKIFQMPAHHIFAPPLHSWDFDKYFNITKLLFENYPNIMNMTDYDIINLIENEKINIPEKFYGSHSIPGYKYGCSYESQYGKNWQIIKKGNFKDKKYMNEIVNNYPIKNEKNIPLIIKFTLIQLKYGYYDVDKKSEKRSNYEKEYQKKSKEQSDKLNKEWKERKENERRAQLNAKYMRNKSTSYNYGNQRTLADEFRAIDKRTNDAINRERQRRESQRRQEEEYRYWKKMNGN